MEPIWRANESGNIGRDFRVINAEVTTRILAIVRERFPESEIAETGPRDPRRVLPGYPVTVDAEGSRQKNSTPRAGRMSTGRPTCSFPQSPSGKRCGQTIRLGRSSCPHNSVGMTLRLMRLQAPFQSERVVFKNRARFTLNQRADRPIERPLPDVVLGLVSGNT